MAGFSVNIGANTFQLKKNLAEVKADLAEVKNSIAAAGDTKPMVALIATVERLDKAVDGFSAKSIEEAFARIDASIEKSADEAQAFKTQLVDLGSGRLPLTSITQFQAAVAQLKADLKTGFSPTISRQPNIVNPGQLENIAKAVKQLPPGFNQATYAVGNFSRIVQDAPFSLLSGNLIAVSNNIDPLIQSFVNLKQQTGSGQAALKALGSSLIGSGGLLLGFSLLNAALTFFSARSMYAKDKTKELAETIKDAAQAEREAVGSVQGTIAQVQNLAQAVTDSNKPYAERKRALQELKDINKSYFGDLTLEADKLGTLTKKVEEYTAALINEEIVKKFSAAIAENAVKIAEAEEKVRLAQESAAESRKKLVKEEGEVTRLREAGSTQSNVFAIAQKRVADATTQYNSAVEESRTQGEALAHIEDTNLVLKNKMNAAQLAGLKMMKLSAAGTNEETDALKKRIEALRQLESESGLTVSQRVELAQLEIAVTRRDAVKLNFTKEEVEQLIEGIIQKHFPDGVDIPVKGRIRIEKITEDIDIAESLGLEEIDLSSWDALIEKMKKASAAKKELLGTEQEQAYADFVVSTLGPAFTDLFENITSDGPNAMEEFGKSIVNIIKRLLAAAAAAIVLSVILKAIFPGASGALGFGDIFGKLVGVPKFATGGIVTRPTLGFMGEMNRPEAIIPLDRLPQILNQLNMGSGSDTLTATVSGDSLLFVLNRAQRKQGRIL